MKIKTGAFTVLKILIVGLCQLVGLAIPAVGLLSVGLLGGYKALTTATFFYAVISASALLGSLAGESVVMAYLPFLEPIFSGTKSLTLWQLANFPIAWIAFLTIRFIDRRWRKNKSSVVP